MQIQEVASIICPQCQTRYNAEITSLINVSSNPELKSALLQDTLNVTTCPQCGYQGGASIPLFYHDSSKELALVLVPTSLNLPHVDEQKVIGDLNNKLINQLPAEERKAYLFTPKTFLTLESLKKAILEADGITEDMLQAQTAKMQLLDQMLRASSEAELKKLVEDNDAELDQQFFEILTATAFQALNQGQQEQGSYLLSFRQLIAEWSSQGTEIIAEIDEATGLKTFNPETLLKDLLNAPSEEAFVNIVRSARSVLDYAFFQNLTNEIENLTAQGQTAQAEELKTLRSRILDVSAKLEEENRRQMARVTNLIKQIMESSNPEQFIKENLRSFDDMFFAVLGANINEAANTKNTQMEQALTNLQNQIIQIITEEMPPELLLLNQLMQMPGPDEAIADLLKQNKSVITTQFMQLLDHAEQDLQSKGQTEAAARITLIKKEANRIKTSDSIILP